MFYMRCCKIIVNIAARNTNLRLYPSNKWPKIEIFRIALQYAEKKRFSAAVFGAKNRFIKMVGLFFGYQPNSKLEKNTYFKGANLVASPKTEPAPIIRYFIFPR